MSAPWVFLHGWGYLPSVWDSLRAHLDAPSYAPALTADDDLTTWADALVDQVPEGAVVVAWSLGALLALQLAARHPARTSKLILFGATARFVADDTWPHGLDAPTVDAFEDNFRRAPSRTLQRFVALQALHDARRAQVTDALAASLLDAHHHADSLTRGLRCLAVSDLRPQLAQVSAPTLLIHGEHDALMPIGAAHWLASALPDAHLECIADAAHAPFVSDTARCAALMRVFAC
ncbi:MAG: alpha/beta fold hydrolase [Rhodocyclaceae bacterium]